MGDNLADDVRNSTACNLPDNAANRRTVKD
jgi:hypothetical protein